VSDLFGLLFSLPTESVAVRAVIASLVAVALAAVLLRTFLSVPRVRIGAALAPIAAIGTIIGLSWGALQLPMVMTIAETDTAYGPLLVRDTYVSFAPLAWPLLAFWAAVAGTRIAQRVRMMRRMCLLATSGAPPRDQQVNAVLGRVADELGVRAPRIVVLRGCPGGAALVGVRRPTLLVDADVLRHLDEEELEGLLAHELAHVRRHDNLLALVVGLVRDALFFVPGGRWVQRRLCAERELAADQLAVGTTGRPGALASGLLKALDARAAHPACAAFAAPAGIVGRVERLVGPVPRSGTARSVSETASVAAALTLAVAIAVQLPAALAAPAEDGVGRNALALLWTWPIADAEPAVATEATAFDVYRRSTPYEPPSRANAPAATYQGSEFHPSYLRGERSGVATPTETTVHTRSAVAARHDEELLRQWSATPVVAPIDRLRVYWLHEVEAGN
jgi:beta-lactamase regulating signal transducer with metallopeptidase domain